MRFFQSIVGAFALASSVVAQTAPALGITSAPSSVTAGQTYTIEFAAPVGQPVTLLLRKGDPDDLNTVATLTSSATGGSYEWSVDQSLESDDDYALEIQQGTSSNYYGPFSLTGGSAASSSSASSSSASSSSASASASASMSSMSSMSSTMTASASLSSAASSLSSLISAANSTLASITSAANATMTSSNSTATPASNSTMRTSTASSTATGSSGSSSSGGSSTASPTGSAPTSGAAMPSIASPIALIFGAIAAIVFLN